jgi:hypothetical protein
VAHQNWALRSRGGEAVKELHKAGFQGVFGANDQEAGVLDEVLDDGRAMAEVVGSGADVGTDGLVEESVGVGLEAGGQEAGDGGADALDDGAQIGRLALGGPLELLESSRDRAAARMAQDDDQPRAKLLGGKLDAADLRRRDDVPGDADDKQVAQTLVKYHLNRHTRVGTAEDDGKRLLAGRQLAEASLPDEGGAVGNTRREAAIAGAQAFDGGEWCEHGG